MDGRSVRHSPRAHTAPPSGGRLTVGHRRAIAIVFGAAWLSGVIGLWSTFAGRRLGEFGPEPHWIESPARAVHGLAAMACLAALGSLLPRHVPSGWASKEKRPSSLFLAAAVVLLILTGWGLYYLGNDAMRPAVRWTHSIVGALLPFPFLLHAVRRPPRK